MLQTRPLTVLALASVLGAGLVSFKVFDRSQAAEEQDAKPAVATGKPALKKPPVTTAATKPDAAKPDAAKPDAVSPPDNPLVVQARDAGVKSCLPRIRKESGAIPTDYAVFSTWAQAAPDTHMFQSVLSMNQGDAAAARSLGLMTAAPTPQGCDATSLQILPVTTSCDAVRADRSKAGHPLTEFNGLYTTPAGGTMRQIMLPAGPSVCVVVTMSMSLDSVK